MIDGVKRNQRVCLKCGKKFWSQGPQNRICWRCNEDNAKLKEMKAYKVVKGKQEPA